MHKKTNQWKVQTISSYSTSHTALASSACPDFDTPTLRPSGGSPDMFTHYSPPEGYTRALVGYHPARLEWILIMIKKKGSPCMKRAIETQLEFVWYHCLCSRHYSPSHSGKTSQPNLHCTIQRPHSLKRLKIENTVENIKGHWPSFFSPWEKILYLFLSVAFVHST